MLKNTLLTLFVFSNISFAICQKQTLINHVKGKAEFKDEVMFYYHNNWELFRRLAKTRYVITDYKIMISEPDTSGYFDVFLTTDYANAEKLAESEDNFRPILKEIRPEGPIMLNEKKPKEILYRVNSYILRED